VLHVESNGDRDDFERLFRLDWDATAVAGEILQSSPELGSTIAEFEGLRVMRPSCSTECFFCFLCTPDNNLTRIVPMVRFLATYGEVMAEVDGVVIHRFPGVEAIAAIPEIELRERAFGYRAATIPSIAKQVLQRGEGWIEQLKYVPYEEAHTQLCELKGIGPKLADCIALFALDHTEAIPIDTHIWQAYIRLYRPECKDMAVTDARYREAAQFLRTKFGRYGGWAQQFLFYDNMMRGKAPAREGRRVRSV